MTRKYYEYEGLGGGIDPKSTSKAKTMTQSMTKAEMIYPKIGIEPKQFTDTHQERCYPLTVVSDLMDEWAAQEVAKEREKAKKLVEALKHIKFGIDVAASQNANYVIETADIELIKQSLIEYGQPNSL